MKKDCITGIVGLAASMFFFYMTATTVRQVPNAAEPGPRLLPYIALSIIALCSIVLIVKSLRDKTTEEKRYFPVGGVKKAAFAYGELVVYGIALSLVGFVVSTPFAIAAFIYTLKGEEKIKPVTVAIISVVVTAFLYFMFVKGFSIKLPTGMLF